MREDDALPRSIKKTSSALCALLALALTCLAAQAEDARRTLIATGDVDSAPYVFAGPNGEAVGFEVELLREIAAKKGFSVEFRLKPWNLALRDLCLKKADILVGAPMASAFAGVVDYSAPSSYDQYAIFARPKTKFKNLGDLAQGKTALQRADPVYEILLSPAGLGASKVWTETPSDAFRELAAGKCDYVAAPWETGVSTIERLELKDVKAIEPSAAPCARRFAVRKGAPELLSTLNDGLAEMKAGPAYERLRSKWLRHERKTLDRNTAIRYGLYVFIPLLLAFDGLLIWSLLLKRQVRRKASDLQESRNNYKLLFDGVGDAVMVSDAKGRIVEFNKGAAKLFANGASLGGKTLQQLFGEAFAKLPASGGKSAEFSVNMPGGKELFLELSCGDAMVGRRKFTVTIARDASERMLVERIKADVERMTRHDLKSPLNGIVAIPELIRMRGPLNEQQDELLKLLESSGLEMLEMINLSQAMYKIERGVYEFRPTTVNVSPIVTKLLLETRPLANARHLTTEVLLDGKPWQEISPFRIWGEETLCHSMLSNLLKNAMEASPEGAKVRLELARGEELNAIAIRNRGAVPREMREKFFEKYTSAGKKGGTGLGTYNAMLVAKVHGGDIQMETSEQEGTCVTVSLPAAKEL